MWLCYSPRSSDHMCPLFSQVRHGFLLFFLLSCLFCNYPLPTQLSSILVFMGSNFLSILHEKASDSSLCIVLFLRLWISWWTLHLLALLALLWPPCLGFILILFNVSFILFIFQTLFSAPAHRDHCPHANNPILQWNYVCWTDLSFYFLKLL